MAVKLRLKRIGRRKRPFYRVVAIDGKTRRDGLEIERLGWFDPLCKDTAFKLHEDRIIHWLNKVAQPSETVENILREIGLKYKMHLMHEGKTEEEVLEAITNFRSEFKSRPGWEKGSPKRANNVTKYTELEKKQGKANMPGHIRASMNWNNCKQMYGDKYSLPITDGAKVIVCKLKNNPMGYTSVAYPTDELRIPQWFQELPFDNEAMEQSILDGKLDNLIGVLGWDVQSTETTNTFNKLFEI